ncbi:MAG: DUF4221 domain-containing protein [Dysgonamonadaceae bacterium]|jgi:hypothetical protein|nr:DUF4221 domain-containing protein [Dysgonamonadaceae bacterium]
MKKNYLYIVVFAFILFSCKKDKKSQDNIEQTNTSYNCELVDTGSRLSYPLDNNTKYQFSAMFPFVDTDGKEYLTFLNSNHEILFYELMNEKFLFKIKIENVGPNGIIGASGYYIENLNSIYITTPVLPALHRINKEGDILQKINYGKTQNGYSIIPTFSSNSFFHTPLFIIDGVLYITQKPNRMSPLSSTPVSVVIDTLNNSFRELPLIFPPLIDDDCMDRLGGGFNLSFSRDFNEKDRLFVYSFYFDENIYIASVNHDKIRKICIKSKYIDKIIMKEKANDMLTGAKQDYETPMYGNLIYDKYRNVYYRMAYPKVELEDGVNYVELTVHGRKRFSIIILDCDFNIIGETLFPEYVYSPSVLFVHKNGLYICNNHPKNSSFNEDILSFSCFKLSKK